MAWLECFRHKAASFKSFFKIMLTLNSCQWLLKSLNLEQPNTKPSQQNWSIMLSCIPPFYSFYQSLPL